MTRRIVGLDLNGRFDLAARDWGEDDEDSGDRPIRILQGGTAAAVVHTMAHRRVAGPQAALAPHGRGRGWGDIGDPGRRRPLSGAIDRGAGTEDDANDLRAAVDALARGADEVVAAVPDLLGFAEAAQGAMIAALRARRRQARLLWRPVAAFLDLLAEGEIGPQDEGLRFRLLIHAGGGIEDQILTLRQDTGHPGHFAPQRDGPGQLCASQVGLDALFDRAQRLVVAANIGIDWSRCDASRLGPALVTGAAESGQTEVLRAWNGNWEVATAPALAPEALGLAGLYLPAPAAPITVTFLVTPLASALAAALAGAVEGAAGPVVLAGPETVARGCLHAGRLIARGLPHYFDRLEPIAIAVMHSDRPAWEHLIPPDAVVPANREHVSPELGGFEWRKRKAELDFYVLKGEGEVRHWTVFRPPGPSRTVPVALRIRQTPGQSWARLTVGAQDWETLARSPVLLDWESLTPLPETPEEVLERLRNAPPTIPERVVEDAHIDLWLGSIWAGEGEAGQLAAAEALGRTKGPDDWAKAIGRQRRHPDAPRERLRPVGTDGDLPPGLPPEMRDGFRAALDRMAAGLCAATLRDPPRDNSLLKALTWSFTACPGPAQEAILRALEALAAGRHHPLLVPSHASRVLHQGSGRAIGGAARLARLFTYLEQAPLNTDTINALAMALSRRQEAPEALTRAQVDHLLSRLGEELIDRIRRHDLKVRFRNTILAIAALFRWRLREPFALLAEPRGGHPPDPAAIALREKLLEAQVLLEDPHRHVAQREDKVAVVKAILLHLDGRGDPGILDRMPTEDDNESVDDNA